MKYLLLFILFTITQNLHAESFIIYTNKVTPLKKKLKSHQIIFENVFSEQEKKTFKGYDLPLESIRLESEKSLDELQKLLSNEKIERNFKASLFFDHLLERQWALKNKGKDYLERISDIDVNIIKGKVGEDIGLDGVKENKDKKIIIAVIDSGVDIKHPDLTKNIYRSEAECKAVALFDKCMKEERDKNICLKKWVNHDADNNGYPLDCNGFSVAATPYRLSKAHGSHNILDVIGHGTHIAGVIGGVKDNGFGIRGAMENVAILPVQVSGAVNSRRLAPNETSMDLVAKGVLYAIKTGAHVINISMGWSLNEDSTLMRKVVELADEKGVVIVAAGGNSAHASPTYPCSYNSVICVGSHSHDGKLSKFSNYGTSLDLTAPGENIISTWPHLMRPIKFTEGAGFEFQNGTSFSAPYVASAIGILINQGFSSYDAVTKMLAGSRKKLDKKTYIRHGNLDIHSAINTQPKSFLYPVNKAPYLIHWKKDEIRSFNLKIVNRGENLKNAKIKVTPIKSNFKMLENSFSVSDWNSKEDKSFQVTFESENDVESDIYFNLDISSDDESKTYSIHAMALTIITPETQDDSIHLPIENAEALESASLLTINNYDKNNDAKEFISLKVINRHTHISLIKNLGDSFTVTGPKKFPLMAPVILHSSRVDVNQDGKAEYVITAVDATIPADEDNNRIIHFYVYDQSFNLTDIKVAKDNQYDNKFSTLPGSFIWIKKNSKMSPAWINQGIRPEHELPQTTSWDIPEPNRSTNRFYYLDEKGIHTIDLGSKGASAVAFMSTADHKKHFGAPLIILAEGFGFYKEFALYQFRNKLIKIRDIKLPTYHDLLGLLPVQIYSYTSAFHAMFYSGNLQGDQRTTAIEWENKNLVIKHTKVKSFSEKFPIYNILKYLDEGIIYQTQFHVGLYDKKSKTHSVLSSKIGPTPKSHQIVGNSKAVFLSGKYTPSIGSEVISVKYDSELRKNVLYRSSLWRMIGAKGCEPIEFITDKNNTNFYFLCTQAKKFILIPYNQKNN